MTRSRLHGLALALAAALAATVALSACGGGGSGASSGSGTAATGSSTQRPATQATATTATTGPGALQAEANAAAAGDIPDNQVFLVFRNPIARYSIRYPEGWAQQGRGTAVTFRDKNNIVRIVVADGVAPTTTSARRELSHLKGVRVRTAPHAVTLAGNRGVAAVYSTQSAPNSVTGKRVTLVVDRYYVSGHGRRAVVDLGTPVGVDNVDAYRMMIESFRWG